MHVVNNSHLWILKVYITLDMYSIHIDGIREIYTKIYNSVYYTFFLHSDSNLDIMQSDPKWEGKW